MKKNKKQVYVWIQLETINQVVYYNFHPFFRKLWHVQMEETNIYIWPGQELRTSCGGKVEQPFT